jgi:hypothetical protein
MVGEYTINLELRAFVASLCFSYLIIGTYYVSPFDMLPLPFNIKLTQRRQVINGQGQRWAK